MRTDDSAIRKTATWLFVLPIFTGGIAQYSARVEAIGLAVLAFATIVVLQKQVSRVAVTRIFSTAATLTLLVCAFLAFRPWPSYGSIHSYNTQAFIFVVTYSAVAIFAQPFF